MSGRPLGNGGSDFVAWYAGEPTTVLPRILTDDSPGGRARSAAKLREYGETTRNFSVLQGTLAQPILPGRVTADIQAALRTAIRNELNRDHVEGDTTLTDLLYALQDLGDNSFVPILDEVLQGEFAEDSKIAAARALGRIGGPSAARLLARAVIADGTKAETKLMILGAFANLASADQYPIRATLTGRVPPSHELLDELVEILDKGFPSHAQQDDPSVRLVWEIRRQLYAGRPLRYFSDQGSMTSRTIVEDLRARSPLAAAAVGALAMSLGYGMVNDSESANNGPAQEAVWERISTLRDTFDRALASLDPKDDKAFGEILTNDRLMDELAINAANRIVEGGEERFHAAVDAMEALMREAGININTSPSASTTPTTLEL